MVKTPDSKAKPEERDTPDTSTNQAESSADDSADLDTALASSPLVAAEETADTPVEDVHDTHSDDGHDTEAHHDAAEHERHHTSLAARALTGLILLLVGGGIALWGAPKVAPHLPNGLGPVKTFLLPGESLSQRQVAELRDEVNTRFDTLDVELDEVRVGEIAADTVATAQADLTERITALSDQVAAADSADIEARLAQLETRVEGLSSQLEGLTGLDLEGLTEEQSAAISGFAAAVEGLRGEISGLAAAQGGISQRIDEVEVSVNRKLQEAEDEVAAVTQQAEQTQSATLIRAALSTIESALSSGEPYEATLAELGTEASIDMPPTLAATAATGVATLGTLRTSFADAAHAAIKADLRAGEDGGVAARLAAFVGSQVASRSLTPQEGDSTDAVLSRAEDALRRDNLAASVEELAALSTEAREAMAGWISRAEARVAAISAFTELKASLSAQN